ncbi:hypothetical protein ACFL2V_15190 [Pseudomonadota bacterium]
MAKKYKNSTLFIKIMPNEVINDSLDVGDRSSLEQAEVELRMFPGLIREATNDELSEISEGDLTANDFILMYRVLLGEVPRMSMTQDIHLPLLSVNEAGEYVVKVEVFNFGKDKDSPVIRSSFEETQSIINAFNCNAELKRKCGSIYEFLKLIYLYLEISLEPVRKKEKSLMPDRERAFAALGVLKFVPTRSEYEFCRREQFEYSVVRQLEKLRTKAKENGVTEELTLMDLKLAFYSKKLLAYPFLNEERATFNAKVEARLKEDLKGQKPGLKALFGIAQHAGLAEWGNGPSSLAGIDLDPGDRESIRNTLVGMGDRLTGKRQQAADDIDRVLDLGERAVSVRPGEGTFVDLDDKDIRDITGAGEASLRRDNSPPVIKDFDTAGIFDVDVYDRQQEAAKQAAIKEFLALELPEQDIAGLLKEFKEKYGPEAAASAAKDIEKVRAQRIQEETRQAIEEAPFVELDEISVRAEVPVTVEPPGSPDLEIDMTVLEPGEEEVDEAAIRAVAGDYDDTPAIEITGEIAVPTEIRPYVPPPKLSMEAVIVTGQASEAEAEKAVRDNLLKEACTKELVSGVQRMTKFGLQFTEGQAEVLYRYLFGKDGESVHIRKAVHESNGRVLSQYGFDQLFYPDQKEVTAGYDEIFRLLCLRVTLMYRMVFMNDEKDVPFEDRSVRMQIYEILLRDQSQDE